MAQKAPLKDFTTTGNRAAVICAAVMVPMKVALLTFIIVTNVCETRSFWTNLALLLPILVPIGLMMGLITRLSNWWKERPSHPNQGPLYDAQLDYPT